MLHGLIRKLGYQKIPTRHYGSRAFENAYSQCKAFTMTSWERMHALWNAMEWLNANNIGGAFVECGVWKGGSSMLAAKNCQLHPQIPRDFFLFDTFEGMSAPDAVDMDFRGKSAKSLMINALSKKEDSNIWAIAPIEQVRENMLSSGIDGSTLNLIKGKVEDTITPSTGPDKIALLRLDTDWYSSTHHELTQLYHRLVPGGFLIVDDYGHWNGCKKAVDEFFALQPNAPFFHRIDYTGIMMQRPLNHEI